MRHRKPSDFRPGDKVTVRFGVHDGERDLSCRQCTVMAVFCENATNPGLAMYDRDNRIVLLSADQVTFIAHEGVA